MATRDLISNSDLANLIKANHEEMNGRLKAVEDQVRLTNGRVKDLEKAEVGRKAVEEYKANQSDKRRFDITTIILLAGAAASFIAGLWWVKK